MRLSDDESGFFFISIQNNFIYFYFQKNIEIEKHITWHDCIRKANTFGSKLKSFIKRKLKIAFE